MRYLHLLNNLLKLDRARKLAPWTVVLAGLVIMGTGCQPINFQGKSEIPAMESESQGMCQVQIVPQFGRARVEKLPIEPGMTVQSILESTRVVNKFRAMDISLSRMVEGSPTSAVLKLPRDFDVTSRTVVSHLDYAIHPGDTVTIRSKPSGSIDKLIDSVTGGAL